MNSTELDNAFRYHRPFGTQPSRYQAIRDSALTFAQHIQAWCPESREKSLALTNLQQAAMWAHAAISNNEQEGYE